VSGLTTMVLAGLVAATPGERLAVPVELQAELLAKVVRYDRNFAVRAGSTTRVLVVYAPESPESERVARALMAALVARPALGGVPHDDELVPFSNATRLVALAREQRATLIVFAPGLASHAAALALAFTDYDGLTVSTTADGVREGLTLGFDLVSGRPHMLLNLTQARRQRIDFRAEVLQLMTVFP
jgi:hypothetical protein